jgi:hypothetical protein
MPLLVEMPAPVTTIKRRLSCASFSSCSPSLNEARSTTEGGNGAALFSADKAARSKSDVTAAACVLIKALESGTMLGKVRQRLLFGRRPSLFLELLKMKCPQRDLDAAR